MSRTSAARVALPPALRPSPTLISPEHLAHWRKLNAALAYEPFGHRHADTIRNLARQLHVTDVLDYGAGIQTRALADPAAPPTLAQALGATYTVTAYDPAVDEIALCPPAPKNQLVVCAEVLQYVEPQHLGEVLGHIFTLSTAGAYLTIGLGPRDFGPPIPPDPHRLIAQPSQWWLDKLKPFAWRFGRSLDTGQRLSIALLRPHE